MTGNSFCINNTLRQSAEKELCAAEFWSSDGRSNGFVECWTCMHCKISGSTELQIWGYSVCSFNSTLPHVISEYTSDRITETGLLLL